MKVFDLKHFLIDMDDEAEVCIEMDNDKDGYSSVHIGCIKIKDNGKTIVLSEEE